MVRKSRLYLPRDSAKIFWVGVAHVSLDLWISLNIQERKKISEKQKYILGNFKILLAPEVRSFLFLFFGSGYLSLSLLFWSPCFLPSGPGDRNSRDKDKNKLVGRRFLSKLVYYTYFWFPSGIIDSAPYKYFFW